MVFMVQGLDNSCYGVLENVSCGILVLRLISVWDARGSGGLHHSIVSGYELQVGLTNLSWSCSLDMDSRQVFANQRQVKQFIISRKFIQV